jgi:hypothetical protein
MRLLPRPRRPCPPPPCPPLPPPPRRPIPPRFFPFMRYCPWLRSRPPSNHRRLPPPRQPGIAKASFSRTPASQPWITSCRSPATNGITRIPYAATMACIGREIAPQTRMSTPSSAKRSPLPAPGSSGKETSVSLTTRPDTASTRWICRVTSKTGAIRLSQTANAAFITQGPLPRLCTSKRASSVPGGHSPPKYTQLVDIRGFITVATEEAGGRRVAIMRLYPREWVA